MTYSSVVGLTPLTYLVVYYDSSLQSVLTTQVVEVILQNGKTLGNTVRLLLQGAPVELPGSSLGTTHTV